MSGLWIFCFRQRTGPGAKQHRTLENKLFAEIGYG